MKKSGNLFSSVKQIVNDRDLLKRAAIDSKLSSSSSGLQVLDLIDAGSLEPTYDIYSQLVKRCTVSKRIEIARFVHAHFLRSSFSADVFFHTSVLNMYAKCRSMDDAKKVFDEMADRNVVAWTAMITGYSQNDRPREALDLFVKMMSSKNGGVLPDRFTFGSVLKAAGGDECETAGKQIHGLSMKCGWCSDVYVGSSLLDMYAKCGKMKEAGLVFHGLQCKNEVTWNALIDGFRRVGKVEIAMEMFREMQRENAVTATQFTYSIVFGTCAGVGSLEQGKLVHAHMIKNSYDITVFVGNCLLDMYAKSGSIDDAKKVFRRLDKLDVVSWNSMLNAYAQHGDGKAAVALFTFMKPKPDLITFLCVLSACSHSGLVKEGKEVFRLMKTKHRLLPDARHYVTMVDLLGRGGLLQEALSFIKSTEFATTNAALWGALLGACRVHRNVDIGKYAAERVFELDPTDSGAHLLLSNIYASVGRLEEASEAKRRLKYSGAKKDAACSWIEVGNQIHVFLTDDKFHPRREEICDMWATILEKIKKAGYVCDEREREEAQLQCHSEKLALAFSLLIRLESHGSPDCCKRCQKIPSL
ncbi:Pentatricopeptide repeat-containing protein [Zostera marina]|uniref:Pentatricopeptide repeat-containing protein n=1 Tax=Zostera marina TaxID=29655 RepID=A0A0K9NT33_ZOSMR|nr:Pentatricopeptide repeat-containing protein [Zostera marina]